MQVRIRVEVLIKQLTHLFFSNFITDAIEHSPIVIIAETQLNIVKKLRCSGIAISDSPIMT